MVWLRTTLLILIGTLGPGCISWHKKPIFSYSEVSKTYDFALPFKVHSNVNAVEPSTIRNAIAKTGKFAGPGEQTDRIAYATRGGRAPFFLELDFFGRDYAKPESLALAGWQGAAIGSLFIIPGYFSAPMDVECALYRWDQRSGAYRALQNKNYAIEARAVIAVLALPFLWIKRFRDDETTVYRNLILDCIEGAENSL
ncbi:MAG: hypothetical protein HS115_10890 [Spirochaetales bacterium]|nr:hypothetical protein [Spirochaetales bacterium]